MLEIYYSSQSTRGVKDFIHLFIYFILLRVPFMLSISWKEENIEPHREKNILI